MSYQTRWANLDDVDNLIRLRFAYFEDEQMQITPEQRTKIEASLHDYISKHLSIDFYVALIIADGQIVSTAFLSIFERPANLSWPTGKTGTVYNVFTYPKYRRQGYSTHAMHMLLDKAREHNLSYVDLSASEMGLPLYQKLGFAIIDHAASHFVDMKLALKKPDLADG